MFGETSRLLDGHVDKCATRVRSHKVDTITCFSCCVWKGSESPDKDVEGVVQYVRNVLRLLHACVIGKWNCGDVCSYLQHLQFIWKLWLSILLLNLIVPH